MSVSFAWTSFDFLLSLNIEIMAQGGGGREGHLGLQLVSSSGRFAVNLLILAG